MMTLKHHHNVTLISIENSCELNQMQQYNILEAITVVTSKPHLLGHLSHALHRRPVQVVVVLSCLDEPVGLDVPLHLFP